MIKRIIKSVLWRTGISQRVPPMIWKSVQEGNTIKVNHLTIRHPNFAVHFDDQEITNSFIEQNAKFAEVKDYVIEMQQPVLVEPVQGLVITQDWKFLEQSRYLTFTYPDIFQYLGCKMGKAKVTEIEEAIHFDGYVGANYYNFYADALTALCWGFEQGGLPAGKPVIVGEKVYRTKFFQWLMKNNAWFGSLPWYVLDGKTYLRIKKLYKTVTFLPDAASYNAVRNLFNPPLNKHPIRRVYLYRAPKFGRTVKNMEEIKPVLAKYDFELVDTGEMSIDEQIQLFADTRYLIAIHGAGITNTLFSNFSKLALLEILPGRDKLNTHYYWLAETLGYRYDAILTEDMNAQMKFNLDPQVLERHINKLLQE